MVASYAESTDGHWSIHELAVCTKHNMFLPACDTNGRLLSLNSI